MAVLAFVLCLCGRIVELVSLISSLRRRSRCDDELDRFTAGMSMGGNRLSCIWARMSNNFGHVVYTKVMKVGHCKMTASMKEQHFWEVYFSLNCTSATVRAVYFADIHNIADKNMVDKSKPPMLLPVYIRVQWGMLVLASKVQRLAHIRTRSGFCGAWDERIKTAAPAKL